MELEVELTQPQTHRRDGRCSRRFFMNVNNATTFTSSASSTLTNSRVSLWWQEFNKRHGYTSEGHGYTSEGHGYTSEGHGYTGTHKTQHKTYDWLIGSLMFGMTSCGTGLAHNCSTGLAVQRRLGHSREATHGDRAPGDGQSRLHRLPPHIHLIVLQELLCCPQPSPLHPKPNVKSLTTTFLLCRKEEGRRFVVCHLMDLALKWISRQNCVRFDL